MKKLLSIFLLITGFTNAQSIQVSPNTYTPQELIEDILINSECISNINVTNAVSGNFGNSMKSYGYFDASGTNFPFESGIVMSTGRLSNVPGPNTSLSDDDANGWGSDPDLNAVLGVNNTTNATVLEFDFVPNANNIRFNYIFASEEYQENNTNTCVYSDVFTFLIKPEDGDYTNIAVVPNTNTPVKVTTVHPEIPGGCEAENEEYFGSFNQGNSPINFNGQTAVLTAETAVTPNQTYHIKLVIADEQNYRYDSAVFLQADSFDISADLGEDHTIANNNPVCTGDSIVLSPEIATTAGSYQWYQDGALLTGETANTYTVTMAGTYEVEVTLASGCVATDAVLVEYTSATAANNAVLTQCDEDGDGLTTYNLHNADAEILGQNQNLQITGYYYSEYNAENGNYPINDPDVFYNASPNQTVYVGIENQFGCTAVATISLQTIESNIATVTLYGCDETNNEGIANFNLTEATTQITAGIAENVQVSYFETPENAYLNTNSVSTNFSNTLPYQQTLYARIYNSNGCYGVTQVTLIVQRAPALPEDVEMLFCETSNQGSVTLYAGVQDNTANYTFEWNSGEMTPSIQVNSAGNYSVLVTNDNGCSAVRYFTLTPSSVATVSYTVSGTVGNNSIQLTATGSGTYVYALDDLNTFQDSPVFSNVSMGVHTAYAKDLNGCGVTSITIYIIGFPNYFTPNSDGVNDTWNIFGENPANSQIVNIAIFDRYGKLMSVIYPNQTGWNGRYKNQIASSDDYWFVIQFTDGSTYKNHFSLVR